MTKRVRSARLNGSLGGRRSSTLLTEEQREARARNAGNSTLARNGNSYFSFLRSLRTSKVSARRSAIQTPRISNSARRLAKLRGE